MAYATPALVRMALVPGSDGSLPDPASNTAADLSDDQLADEIAEADTIVNGYIGKFYAVPVAGAVGDGDVISYPHPVDYWSRDVAAYLATCTYRESQDFADQDPVARRYQLVLQSLIAVSKGQLVLQLPRNASDNAGAGAGAAVNPYTGDLFAPADFGLGLRSACAPRVGGWWGP